MSDGRSTHPTSLRCAHCGDVIGVYEPAVVVEGTTARDTSLAAEPTPSAGAGTWHHRACFTPPGVARPAVA